MAGIGIKNSDVLRVFERGFSGYNGHLTQQSSGLGLYLSKKIVEQLGLGSPYTQRSAKAQPLLFALKKGSWSWIKFFHLTKNVRNKRQNERLGYGSRLLFLYNSLIKWSEVKKMETLEMDETTQKD